MQKNVGGYDRLARFILGPVLVLVGIGAYAGWFTLASGLLGAVLVSGALLVGAVFIVTATTQFCPLNSLLGLNTYTGPELATESGATGPESEADAADVSMDAPANR